mmetsp:Transcript_21976/g.32746  ORF Transcript_21976/g.32746 Transcript_21976/m.32746 type:complete len:389 (+) Transcript_21976:38-1204(+)|eukprot:CAMPEP_0167745196 /NCGR_PEP_ID=MMETSP0110_2-20121227/3018_1 /TAXON_ID=629695 /ORGANISM="Gymnochlora sp., Strain CCMP2014" /LENGTH=388 /DNA_ID=CAMNT_0007629813 /DNA_START=31 /DNA_END=1197 /DNA_ORIENTATION=-
MKARQADNFSMKISVNRLIRSVDNGSIKAEPIGKTLTFDVKVMDTIMSVRKKIEDKTGVPSHFGRIMFAGKFLEDGRTLADYNVQNTSTLYHFTDCRNVSGFYRIFVKNSDGATINLDVQGIDTILTVKKKFSNKVGYSVMPLRLIFERESKTKMLEDKRTLNDYQIKENSTLSLIIPNPGNISKMSRDQVQRKKRIRKQESKRQQKLDLSKESMKIYVKTRTRLRDADVDKQYRVCFPESKQVSKTAANLSIDVKPSDTIYTVKQKIQDKGGIPIQQQRLMFNKKYPLDSRTLADCNIKNESCLELNFLTIFIKFSEGRIIQLDVDSLDTINMVKIMVMNKEGISPKNLCLCMEPNSKVKKEFEGGLRVADYDSIEHEKCVWASISK